MKRILFTLISILSANLYSLAAPDLIVQSQSTTPTTLYNGGSITVSCIVKNQGSTKANIPYSQLSGLYYFLSTNTTYDSGATKLGTSNISDISALGSQTVSGKSLTIPSGLVAGTYYILFFVDKEGDISESNESNNVGIHCEKECA